MGRLLLGMLALAGVMCAADITGTWTGSLSMKRGDETRDESAHVVLKQNGSTVTGSLGPNEGEQYPIAKGTVDGDNVRLEVADGERRFVLELKLEGEKLTGNLKTEGADPPVTGKLTLEKKK